MINELINFTKEMTKKKIKSYIENKDIIVI